MLRVIGKFFEKRPHLAKPVVMCAGVTYMSANVLLIIFSGKYTSVACALAVSSLTFYLTHKMLPSFCAFLGKAKSENFVYVDEAPGSRTITTISDFTRVRPSLWPTSVRAGIAAVSIKVLADTLAKTHMLVSHYTLMCISCSLLGILMPRVDDPVGSLARCATAVTTAYVMFEWMTSSLQTFELTRKIHWALVGLRE